MSGESQPLSINHSNREKIMAKQVINLGTSPTGVGGDTSRSSNEKVNSNADEVYKALGANAKGEIPAAMPINKGGTGATTESMARDNLGLKSAAIASIGLRQGDVTEVGAFGLGTVRKGFVRGTSDAWSLPQFFHLASVDADIAWRTEAGAIGGILIQREARPSALIIDNSTNLYISRFNGSKWTNASRFLHAGNTTMDSNGFVKAASPVCKLFSGKIELNDEAAEQPIVFEKLGVGNYLIKGSLGFSQNGWYIEMPKDLNGNVLIAVEYKQLENNDISIKTYMKKFDIETGDVVANVEKPKDIPEGRWIDLRLQEPPVRMIAEHDPLEDPIAK